MNAVRVGSLCAGLAVVAAYICQPLIKNNPELVQTIVTVLTVFAGFLVAIVTIIGEASLVYNKNWKQLELKRKNVEDKLIRHAYLFVLYLLGIAAAFIVISLRDTSFLSDNIRKYLEYICLFFGFLAFFITFGLPFSIVKTQMRRLDGAIEALREQASSHDQSFERDDTSR